MVRNRHGSGAAASTAYAKRGSHTRSGPSFAPVSSLYGSYMDLEPVQNIDIGSGVIDETKIIPGGLDAGEVLTPGSIGLDSFASTIRPVSIVASLPALPDLAYPMGSFVYWTGDTPLPTLWKTENGTSWVRAIGAGDIQADSITAGQIKAGAIGVSEIDVGAITADKLAVGLVGAANLLKNGGFRNGLTDWGFVQNGDTTAFTVLWSTDFSWCLRDGDIDGWDGVGSPYGSSVSIVSTTSGTYEPYLYQSEIPVVSGQTYSLSVLVGNHRCSAVRAAVWWYDTAGAFLSEVSAPPYTGGKVGGASIDGWERMKIEGMVAPSGAVKATVVLIMLTPFTSLTACYAFFDQCWFGAGGYAREFDTQEASRVRNSDGNVVIDSTGITVTNGKINVTNAIVDGVVKEVSNSAAEVVIGPSGLSVTNGKITVTNASSTVIIDGTSNMFKIAATGTLTKAMPSVATSQDEAIVVLSALGTYSTLPAMHANVTIDNSSPTSANKGRWEGAAPIWSNNTGHVQSSASMLATLDDSNYCVVWLVCNSQLANPGTTAGGRYYILVEAAL